MTWFIKAFWTAVGFAFRILNVLFDPFTLWRVVRGKASIDVVAAVNMRNKDLRKGDGKFLGFYEPPLGHFNGWRNVVRGQLVRTRAITMDAWELSRDNPGYKDNVEKAMVLLRSIFVFAKNKGAVTFLIGNSLKHIIDKVKGGPVKFFKSISTQIVPTIGDNGTRHWNKEELKRSFGLFGVKKSMKIAMLGADGILGGNMVLDALRMGYKDIIGVLTDNESIKMQSLKKLGIDHIELCYSLSDLLKKGKVDVVIACTHNKKLKLTKDSIEALRKDGRQVLVLDMSQPHNVSKEVYAQCHDFLSKVDCGNAYSPKIIYILGIIAYRMCVLGKHTMFGCYSEATALAMAIKEGYEVEKIRSINWLEVTDEGTEFIAKLFKRYGFSLSPVPLCFGKPIKNYDLSYQEKKEQRWLRVLQEVPVLRSLL